MVRKLVSAPRKNLSKKIAHPPKSKSGHTKASDKYEYNELYMCEQGTEKVNFFATVLDAQFPHKSFRSDKYVCSMKICDSSCPIEEETQTVEHYTLVLFANKFEDLPIIQQVGDIIRVHRANVGTYR